MASKELTVIERAAVALGTAEHEKTLVELVQKSSSIVEIKNNAGREQCHRALMTIRDTRVNLRKVGKDARDDATKFSKAVIVEEDRLVGIIEPEEKRLQGVRDTWDEAREAEKRARLEAEQRRVELIRSWIEEFRTAPAYVGFGTSAEITEHADDLARAPIDKERFQELTEEAEAVRVKAVTQLRTLAEKAAVKEAEEARLVAERADLARLRAEQEERDRVAAAERAAQEEADRLARAEQERRDREAREAEDTRRRVAQRRADEAIRTEREAHEKRMAGERADIQRQQDQADADRRQQREEADLLANATQEIQGIQHQLIIATVGRLGVRVGGTIDCIRDTLTETEAWTIDPVRFGALAGIAERTKATVVKEIRRLLVEAEANAARDAEDIAREAADTAMRNAAPVMYAALIAAAEWLSESNSPIDLRKKVNLAIECATPNEAVAA